MDLDIKSTTSVRRKSKGPCIQQPPMVFELSEPSDKSDDWIFGKPKWTSKSKKRRLKRKRSLKKMNEQKKESMNVTKVTHATNAAHDMKKDDR